jgi:hypothetical protein
MSNFRESFTTDERIIAQWENDMMKQFDADSYTQLGITPKGNRVLCFVLNARNGKSFRCIAPKYLERYALARCYARATGQRVKTHVTQVSMKGAMSYPEWICRPILYISDAEGNTRTELQKYKVYSGDSAKTTAYDAITFNTMSDKNHEFYIKSVHVYDL